MNREEDQNSVGSIINVSATREHFRRRVIEAKKEVIVLVRLADNERRLKNHHTPHVSKLQSEGQ